MATDGDALDDGVSTWVRRGALAPAVIASVGDPTGERTVTAIVALLVVLGVGLVMLLVWLIRVTRPDPEVLAPLELMGERAWRRGDPVWQRRRLDEVRPDGAEPLRPSAAPPEFDAAFDAGPRATGFDDLHDHDRASIPGDPLVAGRASNGDVDPTVGVLRGPATTFPPRPAAPRVGAQERPRVTLLPPLAPPAAPEPEPEPEPESAPSGVPAEREIAPELMAAAVAELDAELGVIARPSTDVDDSAQPDPA